MRGLRHELGRQVHLSAAGYGGEGSRRAAAALDRGPLRARGAAGLADGGVVVMGNAAGY